MIIVIGNINIIIIIGDASTFASDHPPKAAKKRASEMVWMLAFVECDAFSLIESLEGDSQFEKKPGRTKKGFLEKC